MFTRVAAVRHLTDEALESVHSRMQKMIADELRYASTGRARDYARTARACEKEINKRLKYEKWAKK